MSLNIIHHMRRNIRAIETLARAQELTPERLTRILSSMDADVDTVETYLEHARVTDAELEPERPPRSGPFLAFSRSDAPNHGGDAA